MAFTFATIFPVVFPIRFYPESDNTDPNYNFVQFDQKSYADTAMDWQTNMPYTQKCTLVDRVDIQVHIQEGDPGFPSDLLIEIFDCNNNFVATLDISHFYGRQVISGNTYTDPATGTVVQLASYHYSFMFGEYTTGVSDPLNGIYTLRVSNYSGQSDFGSLYYRSEPILVYPKHPNTMLIEAWNNTNRAAQNYIITGWDGATITGYLPKVRMRVESHIEAYNPKGFLSGYLQQEYTPQQTAAQNFRTFLYKLGSITPGVPEYVYEKVAEQLICDNVMLDGKFFSYDHENESGVKGAWKRNQNYGGTLGWSELPIRERYKNQNASVTVIPYEILPLWRSPRFEVGHDPDIFEEYFIKAGYFVAGGIVVPFQSLCIMSDTDEDSYIASLNSVIASLGLLGVIQLNSDNHFAYFSASGDHPVLPTPVVILSKFILGQYLITNPTPQISFQLTTMAGGEVAVYWNDGTTAFYQHSSPFSADLITPFYDYSLPAPDYRTIWIFHNDKISKTKFYDSTLSQVTGVFNVLPSQLKWFEINPASALQVPFELDTSMCPGLEALVIVNTNITSFGSTFLDSNQPSLGSISLTLNHLSSSAVDAALNAFVANTPVPNTFPHQFSIQAQTPAAPPTGASATARTFLTGLGWSVNTD